MKYQQDDIVDVWDRVAESYSASSVAQPDYQANIHVMLQHIGNPSGKTMCEVGCGSAVISAVFGHKGAEISLVDKSSKALDFAQRTFNQEGLKAKYYLQDATDMEFPDGHFDVVWNAGVIEHFRDEGKIALIREMWRIVKPGGILLIMVPNKWDIPFVLGKWLAMWRKTWQFGYEDDLSSFQLRKLARLSGLSSFTVFAFNPIVGWWFLPYGNSLTKRLGLNTTAWHKRRCPLGHVLGLSARKSS